jgi:hypothetical protein
MHLEHNPAKIIIYSLSLAFVTKTMLIPFIKDLYLKQLERTYDKIRAGLRHEDNVRIDELSNINQEWNDRRKRIATATHRPFDCIKCMTFWSSMIIAICIGYQGEAAFVGIVGLAAGMLLEGILMRYF